MTDALVIGGGLAGAALATHLARAGKSVTLVEREAHAHDKVCGEFISHEAASYLSQLGIDLPAMGAVPIQAVRLYRRGLLGETALPFAAWSLSRRVLDEAVLAKAAEAGATVARGTQVSVLTRIGSPPSAKTWSRGPSRGWQARAGHGMITARDAFLCTGKHDLRGYKRPQGLQNDLVGFKMHFRLSPAQQARLGNCVELMLFPGGYAGLEPIENGSANLCLLIRRRALERIGADWTLLLQWLVEASPPLGERLLYAQPAWPKPLAIAAIPYGYVRRRADGLWRLGDQAAVIPSFAGDGMSIALHSAHRCAGMYLSGASAETYQRVLAADLRVQVWRATALSHLLVRTGGQSLAAAAAMPSLMRLASRKTRIHRHALASSAGNINPSRVL